MKKIIYFLFITFISMSRDSYSMEIENNERLNLLTLDGTPYIQEMIISETLLLYCQECFSIFLDKSKNTENFFSYVNHFFSAKTNDKQFIKLIDYINQLRSTHSFIKGIIDGTLFQKCIKKRVIALLKEFARKNIFINLKDTFNNTALHRAVRDSNPETVKLLLTHPDINLSSKNASGYTALHMAVSCARIEMVQLLLNCAKVDPTLTNNAGETPLELARRGLGSPYFKNAREKKMSEIFRLLSEHEKKDTPHSSSQTYPCILI